MNLSSVIDKCSPYPTWKTKKKKETYKIVKVERTIKERQGTLPNLIVHEREVSTIKSNYWSSNRKNSCGKINFLCFPINTSKLMFIALCIWYTMSQGHCVYSIYSICLKLWLCICTQTKMCVCIRPRLNGWIKKSYNIKLQLQER